MQPSLFNIKSENKAIENTRQFASLYQAGQYKKSKKLKHLWQLLADCDIEYANLKFKK